MRISDWSSDVCSSDLLRATPLLMIIFWIYFLLPLWLGGSPNRFFTVLISLVIFEGAYISIIVQCGIDGLAKGQMESARALGFSYGRAMTLVVMPQVLRIMLPSDRKSTRLNSSH